MIAPEFDAVHARLGPKDLRHAPILFGCTVGDSGRGETDDQKRGYFPQEPPPPAPASTRTPCDQIQYYQHSRKRHHRALCNQRKCEESERSRVPSSGSGTPPSPFIDHERQESGEGEERREQILPARGTRD